MRAGVRRADAVLQGGGVKVIGLVGALTLVSFVWFVGVMGPELAGRMRFLPVEAARFISVAEFLERMEALTVSFSVFVTFAKLSVWYYAAVICLAEVLGLGDYRPMVWPVGLLIGEGSMLFFGNIAELASFIRWASTPYMLVFEVAIPLVVLLVSMRPLLAPLVTFMVAALFVGSTRLKVAMQLDQSLAGVLQGLIVLMVLLSNGLRERWRERRRFREPEAAAVSDYQPVTPVTTEATTYE
ncbi:MAG: spore germination protein [Limnochordales bacterium]